MPPVQFPSGFLWGSATAAHQVEGQNGPNDWVDWEKVPGHIKDNETSEPACEWWKGRYRQDLQLARSLGQNTHRLSVDWSRLEPQEGAWDRSALEVYRDMLEELHRRELEPMVTLFHFVSPRWLAEKGGWTNPAAAVHFARFAARVVGELGSLCNFWVTLNEPNVYAYNSFSSGDWPPQVRNFGAALRVMANLVRAHHLAFQDIKRAQPAARVGVAHQMRVFRALQGGLSLDRVSAYLRDRIFNRLTFDSISNGRYAFPLGLGQERLQASTELQDYIGLNYYYTENTAFDLRYPEVLFSRTVLDPWALEAKEVFGGVGNVDPTGLELLLHRLRPNALPIYITENGIFELDAENQSRYLVSHLMAVHRAIQSGVPVKGFYWWSLMDNFEWAEGYGARFGLYRVNFSNQARTAKPVAEVYGRIARENAIAPDLVERFGNAV